jgi:colanic acid/amylovoran biosynthesis glycosyltransferase
MHDASAGPQRKTILVYRDRIVPLSELNFLRRQYVGFSNLNPVWVGRTRGNGLADLGADVRFLGRPGVLGAVDREVFKHVGRLPPEPDLRALKPKLVHAHFGRGGALSLPMARSLGVPLVVSFYGADATKDKQYRRFPPGIFRRRLNALRAEAVLFLCVSDFIRERLIARGFPPEKLLVQHSGVNIDAEYGPVGPSTDPYILFAGRFVEKKGVPSLIEAMRRLQAEGRRLSLVLVGDGPMEQELRQAASSLNHVTWLGWMPNDELRRWMRGALALCVPSQHASGGDAEGLPTVVLEAMAAGTPVVGSRHAGIHEAVDDQFSGFLIPEKDPDAIAAAIRRLADEPGMRLQFGENARRSAVDRFDMLVQSRRLEERLLSAIGAA